VTRATPEQWAVSFSEIAKALIPDFDPDGMDFEHVTSEEAFNKALEDLSQHLTQQQLSDMCKENKIPSTGAKKVMLARLAKAGVGL
jgi:hypothetical protein